MLSADNNSCHLQEMITEYIVNTRWVSFDIKFTRQGFENISGKARIFLLVDLREFFFRFRVGGTKKKKKKKLWKLSVDKKKKKKEIFFL